MTFWTDLFAVYSATTIFAIYMTYKEQQRQERPSFLFNLIGYLCCAIWPLVAAVFVVLTCRRMETASSGRAE